MNDQVTRVNHDRDYTAFLARVNARVIANAAGGADPLFTTDAKDLWRLYLDSFADPVERQYHNCHACRQFIERFGALVTIGSDGRAESAIWNGDDAAYSYRPALVALAKAVRRAKVTGVFLSSKEVWGTPETGVWKHFALTPPASILYKRATLTAEQAMAEKREDFRTVMNALNEFTLPHLETALTLLKTDALYRSEKVLGQAEWLHALHISRAAAQSNCRANVVWRAVATAPAGFCHPRRGMIGTLLEDIAAGKEYDEVARAFAAKMRPSAYQRPQAAPTAGAIATAEKLIQQLGAVGALARRFARLDEVKALWRPAPTKDEVLMFGSVFGHLKSKGTEATNIRIPAQIMTWYKFQHTVLPTAERIEFLAPVHGSYAALVTAINADAPPILQWDLADSRNPVSWYFWRGGSPAAQFGLRGGEFVEVEALALQPSLWNLGFAHQGAGLLFILAGARESKQAGAALFPEILRAEFHGIRSVIEAYSRSATIEGMNAPHAAGIMLVKGNAEWDCTVRVWSSGRSLEYKLDRWD